MKDKDLTPVQRAARYQVEADQMLAEFRDMDAADDLTHALVGQRKDVARHLKRCGVCKNAVSTVRCMELLGIKMGLMAILFALASAESADFTKGEASSE